MPDPDRADISTDAALSSQQCGRCRKVFEMEPTAEPGTIPDAWYCASCRVALLGRPTSVARALD